MIHVLTPYSRNENISFYLEKFKELQNKVIWHPIFTPKQYTSILEYIYKNDIYVGAGVKNTGSFLDPYILPHEGPIDQEICYYKFNMYIINQPIDENDYFFFLNDDDWVQEDLFDKVPLTKDVTFISMKRGHNQPLNGHPTVTLMACPAMHVGTVGLEQYFIKGKVMKQIRFRTDGSMNVGRPPDRVGSADGYLAEFLMANFDVQYEPDLYSYFNYLEPGRWNKE